ncbi:MAG TPA: TIGR00159 family protein [Phycisphaerae bacterium]|nr:TIGR00159 family protein [Phycisphaerae bacterium]
MKEILDAITIYYSRVMTYNPIVVGLEMLLIGLVVWQVIKFLKGTRGARLVKGVAVLLVSVYVVIRLLPEELGWDRVKFLYGNFLIFAFVAVVVAFQPELRRALIQIGKAKLFQGKRGQVESTVAALIESSSYLARNKIGALIAIEQSVGLGAIAETGTAIDAGLTVNLLNAIFYPGSALHDMGVIINHGRIAAAGCQLPLAESDDVDASLGSRHRAALGLCQETDAVVLVVSEETGRISIAHQGQLHIGLVGDNLREMLMGLLDLPRRRKARAKKSASGGE